MTSSPLTSRTAFLWTMSVVAITAGLTMTLSLWVLGWPRLCLWAGMVTAGGWFLLFLWLEGREIRRQRAAVDWAAWERYLATQHPGRSTAKPHDRI